MCKLCDSIKKNELTPEEIARAFLETVDDEDDLHNQSLWEVMGKSGKMEEIEEAIWNLTDIDLAEGEY